ncbi:TPA: TraI/MobA(P) family conjugative relaxase, partial [Pseudomonas aeruginosa]
LVGWIKRECLDEIKGAASWAELHQVMRDNGLALRARGNGLVIEAGDGTIIKASTLARDLSKPALEKRLGTFEASPERQATPARRSYQKGRPMRLRGGLDTTELYARYKGAQQNLTAARAGVLAEAKRRKDRAIENAKKAAATRRAAIKHLTDGRLTKKLLYSQASAALRADLEAIHKRHDQERAAIYNEYRRRPWADWLKQQATAGDGQALDALRAREAAHGLKGDTIQGDGPAKPGHAPVIDNITKKGTIIYRAGSSAVRDDGERLAVSSQADRAGVAAALRLAMERYGERITVSGSVEFKAAVIRAAVDAQLPITFADPALESRRQAEATKAQAKRRSGVPPVGQEPPPHRRNGLHTLGQLDRLHIEGEARRPAQAPTQATPTPPAAKVQQPARPAPSELEQREARLRAQMEAKKAKRQEGKKRGR